jgi:hypothetical protein
LGQNIPQILATLDHFWGHKNTFTQILCVGCIPFFLLPGDENLPQNKPLLTTCIPWANNFLFQPGFCCFELLQSFSAHNLSLIVNSKKANHFLLQCTRNNVVPVITLWHVEGTLLYYS